MSLRVGVRALLSSAHGVRVAPFGCAPGTVGTHSIHQSAGSLLYSVNEKCFPGQPEMPPCDFSPMPYESYPYDQILQIRKRNISPAVFTIYKKPLLIHQGHMQWLFDSEGRRYLDFIGGIVTVSVGHCHPKVTVAAQKQMARVWHTTNIYLHPTIHEYAEKLTSLLPEQLKVVYVTNSGSEANDLAMFMARLYTKNFDLIGFRGAYHGGSPYALGLTTTGHFRYSVANGFGCHTTMCPDVYRGPWGGQHCRDSPVQTTRQCSCSPDTCQANDKYIEQLKEVLDTCVSRRIAGFIAEPIQGMGGAVQYPKGFLKEAYRLVRERGAVCIADEVQTGFGRTGSHFWGFQGHDVLPDIVTMAKGIGNGFPMAAVVTTTEIAASMGEAVHFNTFGGNPVAGAVGSAVLDAIEEDGLQKNCDTLGTYFLKELAKLRDRFEIVGDVRGKGLMIGVELVTDKESRKPLSADQVAQIWEDCKDMGLLIGKGGLYSQVFRIKPPMCITLEDVDFGVAVLHLALERHMERRRSRKESS